MSRIRVLIVDDAVVIRRIVSDVLSADPEIEVAGTAANGKIALQKLTQVNPDLITLDVEMPEMDGLETLRELKKTHPRVPVIMFSTLTARGASTTLDALASGARDYVTKPANVGSVATAMERIREELIPKIKALCTRVPPASLPSIKTSQTIHKRLRRGPTASSQGIKAVVIGVSTGGPNALAEMLPQLPADLPVPVLIVQHMPPVFTKLLAQRLNEKCPLHVKEAVAGEPIYAGNVYLAPGDFHMKIVPGPDGCHIGLNQEMPENSCRPAVDVLFRSAVETFGANVLGVIMTGMGQDGFHGCRLVSEAGGPIVVQDEASSVVWGMPGCVAQAELADQIVPLDEIAQQIVRWVVDKPGTKRMSA